MKVNGLVDVVASVHRVDASVEARGRLERYGFWKVLSTLPKVLLMTLFDKNTRRVMKESAGALSGGVMEQLGYGVFAGRKV